MRVTREAESEHEKHVQELRKQVKYLVPKREKADEFDAMHGDLVQHVQKYVIDEHRIGTQIEKTMQSSQEFLLTQFRQMQALYLQ